MWLACDHAYWSSVYRAAKMLGRYSGIEGSCLDQYAEVYRDVAAMFARGNWAAANTAKAQLTCAAGRAVRIDSESISLLCTDQRWTPEGALTLNCPDPAGQHEEVSLTGSYDELPDGYTILLHNNSAVRSVRVTEWTLYNCQGIRGSICQRHTKPVIIGPGQTVELGRAIKESGYNGYNFQWNWSAEFVE